VLIGKDFFKFNQQSSRENNSRENMSLKRNTLISETKRLATFCQDTTACASYGETGPASDVVFFAIENVHNLQVYHLFSDLVKQDCFIFIRSIDASQHVVLMTNETIIM
jgi:hypothetical protein